MSSVIVFPNPAESDFRITLPEGHTYNKMSIMNHLGQEMYSRELDAKDLNITINPDESWSKGIYFVRLSGINQPVARKVILQ